MPSVVERLSPYVSSEDIRKGSRWFVEVSERLNHCDVGVLCLVPENVAAPWLLFEAGALSKSVQHARLVPLLVDVPVAALADGPLAQFQAVSFGSKDVLRLTRDLNELLGDERSVSYS